MDKGTCLSWTYVEPGTIQEPNPRCWLKNATALPANNGVLCLGSKVAIHGASKLPRGGI